MTTNVDNGYLALWLEITPSGIRPFRLREGLAPDPIVDNVGGQRKAWYCLDTGEIIPAGVVLAPNVHAARQLYTVARDRVSVVGAPPYMTSPEGDSLRIRIDDYPYTGIIRHIEEGATGWRPTVFASAVDLLAAEEAEHTIEDPVTHGRVYTTNIKYVVAYREVCRPIWEWKRVPPEGSRNWEAEEPVQVSYIISLPSD